MTHAETTAPPAMQVIVLLVDTSGAGSLERVLGLLRRRAPAYAAMNITSSVETNIACVTIMLRGARAAAEGIAEHLRKLVDVRDCTIMNTAAP